MLALTGFDSGVFVLLASGHPDATRLWEETVSGERPSRVSALTLFEIYRLGLKGIVPLPFAEDALRNIPNVCEVIWIDGVDLIRTGARLSQGMALAMADALILASLADCREIYTTDTDLAQYRKSGLEITLLRPL